MISKTWNYRVGGKKPDASSYTANFGSRMEWHMTLFHLIKEIYDELKEQNVLFNAMIVNREVYRIIRTFHNYVLNWGKTWDFPVDKNLECKGDINWQQVDEDDDFQFSEDKLEKWGLLVCRDNDLKDNTISLGKLKGIELPKGLMLYQGFELLAEIKVEDIQEVKNLQSELDRLSPIQTN